MGLIQILILIALIAGPSYAKLGNNTDENISQYGQAIDVETLPTNQGFTGYITYNINDKWKLKAFFIDNKVRVEHLVQKTDGEGVLTRSEVRDLAFKMFTPNLRGSYKRQVNHPRVEGHFFEKGLIAYEYFMDGNKKLGYKAIKVLLYEGNQSFGLINPKAYL